MSRGRPRSAAARASDLGFRDYTRHRALIGVWATAPWEQAYSTNWYVAERIVCDSVRHHPCQGTDPVGTVDAVNLEHWLQTEPVLDGDWPEDKPYVPKSRWGTPLGQRKPRPRKAKGNWTLRMRQSVMGAWHQLGTS